jgi:KUP system potassium uptake protein
LGATEIADNPGVLAAVNPAYAAAFLTEHAAVGLVTLGFVFLAVTGGEALYADLGHFGRRPIQTAWFVLVLPALVINYFGQGALVLNDPEALEHPFYRLVPDALRLPMVALATAATAIASQAVITGAYSLTQQAIQLGLLPRLVIRHTSEAQHGQIYMPRINGMLLAGSLLLVALFQTSSALAAAYGLAVATTMAVDGLLALIVIRELWRWPAWLLVVVAAPFLLADLMFLPATMTNLFEGAWLPVLFGAVVVLLIVTWRRGVDILAQKTQSAEIPLDALVKNLERKPPHIIPGTAIFLTSNAGLRACRAAAQSQAQQGLARTERGDKRGHGRCAARERRRTRAYHADEPAIHQNDALLRVHGTPERSHGARPCAQARLEVRHHVDVILRVATIAQAGGEVRHAELARPDLSRPCSLGQRCHRLFPDSDRTRRRDRHAGHLLKWQLRPPSCAEPKVYESACIG